MLNLKVMECCIEEWFTTMRRLYYKLYEHEEVLERFKYEYPRHIKEFADLLEKRLNTDRVYILSLESDPVEDYEHIKVHYKSYIEQTGNLISKFVAEQCGVYYTIGTFEGNICGIVGQPAVMEVIYIEGDSEVKSQYNLIESTRRYERLESSIKNITNSFIGHIKEGYLDYYTKLDFFNMRDNVIRLKVVHVCDAITRELMLETNKFYKVGFTERESQSHYSVDVYILVDNHRKVLCTINVDASKLPRISDLQCNVSEDSIG